MEGVNTDKAPSAGVVVPHFIVAAIGFFLLSILVFTSSNDFLGHFYQSRLLAITHLAALGWVTMIIFGALYQLIPVVFETALYSERIAKINLWFFLTGLVMMVVTFWTGGDTVWLIWSAIITFIALILFSINVLLSIWGAAGRNYSSRFIATAILWLLSTAIMGLLLALNRQYALFDASGWRLLKVHAHFGMIGWFLQLIMGIASVLVPMFLVSHDLKEKKLVFAYRLVNAGLILLGLGWLLRWGTRLLPLYSGIIILGVLFFLGYLRDAYRQKLRKLDIGMKLTTVALVAIFVPIVLGLWLSFQHLIGISNNANASTLYGFTIFFAFITPLILGQTYKTLPFIIWLDRYQPFIGKKKIPLPADLFSILIAEIHLWTYLASVLFLSVGIMTTTPVLARLGALFLVVTAILYLANVLKIVTHRRRVEDLATPKPNKGNDLLDLLKTVIDPEVEINIVDMGLIYKLDYDGDKKVDIEMTLSTPNCPIADSIVMNVMETILKKHPDYDVNVHLVFEPKWSPDKISPEGKRLLKEGHKWKEKPKS